MPFVRIALRRGKSAEYIRAIADAAHEALVHAFAVPADDRFQFIQQYDSSELFIDPGYLGMARSEDFVFVHVVGARDRAAAVKETLYRRLVALLGERLQIRPDDVMVVVQTTRLEDWSLGRGEAQMLYEQRPRGQIGIKETSASAVVRDPLLSAALGGSTIERVETVRVDLPPNLATGLHLHPCDVVGIVVRGSVRFQIEGYPERVLNAGDAFHEPAGRRIPHFDALGDGASFVAHYLLPPGEHELLRMLE